MGRRLRLALNEQQRAIYAAIASGTAQSAEDSAKLEEKIAETRASISDGIVSLKKEGD